MSGTEQNKSEPASPYKLEQARKKGIVAKSPELAMVTTLACVGTYMALRGDLLFTRLSAWNAHALGHGLAIDGGGSALLHWLRQLASQAAWLAAPLLSVIFVGAWLVTFAQTGWLFAPAALKPDLSRVNPMLGLKRLLSWQTLVEAAKACAKLAVYTTLMTLVIYGVARTLALAPHTTQSLAIVLGAMGLELLFWFVGAAALFAAIDQWLVRRMFARKMRMSRHEQKQEFKQREGDPRIKQRRRQLQRELLQRAQSLRNVRNADILVANPTHYAVALRYDALTMSAPTVVAKGSGEFALRLRRLAFVYSVPVIEARTLARTLFRTTRLEQEIPDSAYQDTAALYLRLRTQGSQGTGA